MDQFPIFLNLKGQPCVVVGGGEVAARKIGLMHQAGAAVTVIAPELCETVARMVRAGEVRHIESHYVAGELPTAMLVVAATNDRKVNIRVSEDAKARHIPVNAVDDPELSTYIMPSILDRSPLVVAVSTGGASPVLARLTRARLETLIPAAYGRLAGFAARMRDRVKERLAPGNSRRGFWETVLEGPIGEMVLAGQEQAAERAFAAALERSAAEEPARGEVYLVGGGPGNPDLLTFRALRLMQQADVVVYDHLISPKLIDLCRRDARRIYAGKERSNHAIPQEELNHLLVRLAKEGNRVLRLKGGDPFIFGRGGEEIETLAAHGIPFQVVPGITAAAGAASYAGIPLTHREHAQSCVLVTGHLKDGRVNLDWHGIARPNQTIVVYMGLLGLPSICAELVKHGLAPTTPVAVVQQATTLQQRVVTGTLETIAEKALAAGLKPPTLIIVGEVVKLREQLAWFDPDAAVEQVPVAVPEAAQ